VKTLTKKKKDNEHVLTDLELINLKNVSLLQFEELIRKTTKVGKKKLTEDKKNIRELYSTYKHSWRWHKNKGEVWI